MMQDALRTVNDCSVQDVEKCRDKDDLRELIIRRQPKFDTKIAAGGALNYLNEGFKFIMT